MLKFNQMFLVVGTGIIFTHSAHAADSNGLDKTTEQEIEVIEVFAQKRAQNIADVSVAVTAITGETIDKFQLKDSTQLAQLTPSMKVTNNAGEGTPPAFNIRGVGMIDYNTSTISPIAIYSDGVVSGSANNLSVNLFDLEQAEVLRGPQGTLFGRNTTGGAILLRSKMPEKHFGGYVNASVAQHDHTSVDGAVNLPISSNTAARFAFNQEDYNFSTNNLMADQPDGGLKQTNLRLIVRSEFDKITTTFKFHNEDWSGKPKPIASNGILKVDGSGQCSPSQAGSSQCMDAFGRQVGGNDFWDVNADTADREHDTESWGASFSLEWQISPALTLNSISATRELERFHSWDSDGPSNLIEGTMGTDNTLVSQEVNLAYQNKDLFWQSGIFYIKEEIDQDNSFDLFRDFRPVPELASIPAEFFYDNTLENSSIAFYSQADYQIADSWLLTAGLRYTDEETKYHAKADLDTVAGVIPEFWNLKGKVADDEVSGKLALHKTISNAAKLYASYTRGYKSGGYNAGYSTSPFQAADSEYAPETLNAYEVGAKLTALSGDLSWHLAGFYYDYQDQQVFVNVPDNIVPYHVLKNAGDSEIYGIDSELRYAVNNNFDFILNIGYLPKANIGEYQEGNLVVADNRLPFSSKWNISGYITYDTNVYSRQLTAQIGFDYQSDFYFDQNENDYTGQTDFTVVNGRIGYQVHPDILLSIWGKNLTETEFAELRFDSTAALGAITELKGEGRQIGVAVNYSF